MAIKPNIDGPLVDTLEDKVIYYREQLLNELATMFKWTGFDNTVPVDYLERTLVREGYALFFNTDLFGHDVMGCRVTGYNRHNLPVNAEVVTNSTVMEYPNIISRRLKYQTDGPQALNEFNDLEDGVLIQNMPYGQNMQNIVNFFAHRMALALQAFDTQLLYANLPYIFVVDGDDVEQSVRKLFNDIFTGKPNIIVDKALLKENKDRAGVPTNINFLAKDIMDVMNEWMMKFRERVGFDTAGVDKKERVLGAEVESNKQHTKSVVEVMLQQRQIAAENINYFFGRSISVNLLHDPEEDIDYSEGDEDYGTGDSGVEELTEN